MGTGRSFKAIQRTSLKKRSCHFCSRDCFVKMTRLACTGQWKRNIFDLAKGMCPGAEQIWALCEHNGTSSATQYWWESILIFSSGLLHKFLYVVLIHWFVCNKTDASVHVQGNHMIFFLVPNFSWDALLTICCYIMYLPLLQIQYFFVISWIQNNRS